MTTSDKDRDRTDRFFTLLTRLVMTYIRTIFFFFYLSLDDGHNVYHFCETGASR